MIRASQVERQHWRVFFTRLTEFSALVSTDTTGDFASPEGVLPEAPRRLPTAPAVKQRRSLPALPKVTVYTGLRESANKNYWCKTDDFKAIIC